MQSFLEEVIDDLIGQKRNITEYIYVLPSKRAGTFLRNAISKKLGKTIISPDIYSIEEFIEKISGLSYASQTQQIFELYNSYLKAGPEEKEPFDSYLNWAQTLLQDFNEIDRYLIDASDLFSGLSAIQEVNHWSLKSEKTTLMENYLHFWKNLNSLYTHFNNNLLSKRLGHQGLVYRKAAENIDSYVKLEKQKHVFLGFNALNTAESKIIQTILTSGGSHIYWDIDPYFLNDKIHDAGFFIRKHKTTWSYFASNDIKGMSHHYLSKKQIEIVGVPKNIAQAKYAGSLLKELQAEKPESLKNTAIVLGDESLLNPLINSLPSTIPSVNITMGQKLALSGLASFFDSYLDLHLTKTSKGWFYKDFISFLSHSNTDLLLTHVGIETNKLVTIINLKNWTYIKDIHLDILFANNEEIRSVLFAPYQNPKQLIDRCNYLIENFKDEFISTSNKIELEHLYKFHKLFNQIEELTTQYHFLTTLKAFHNLYKQLLSTETMDFQGDPLEGLQVMGMLESRNIDFETIILTSVNEGILPSGKSNNSFIPFDLKTEYGLPTYKEKDAVYTYHFYRLLQRAKNIYLLYNTEPDVLEGGEKSRLITQLLTDENRTDIFEKIAAPKIAVIPTEKQQISKTPDLVELINSYTQRGFSPSSLSNYIRNPIDFYKQNLMNITETNSVEEHVAANTFGTIVHDTLEELYTPFIGKELSIENLQNAKKQIKGLVKINFEKTYLDGNITTGKNLIAHNVIIKYIENFIDAEIKELKTQNIKIVALEEKLKVELRIPGIEQTVILKGKLDRVDIANGITRIIDFKTGKVERRNVEVTDWNTLIDDYGYSKAFQLLCYSYMFLKTRTDTNELNAGIISLKNLKSGLLQFAQKESSRSKKNILINHETITLFEEKLFLLIKEICNADIPFIEKEV